MSKHDDVKYWAEILKENSNSIAPLTKQMNDNAPAPLPVEDVVLLRALLTRNAVLIDLLNTTVQLPDPQPRWKKFFRIK